ncbi:MAG: D-alanyl-D-alanine carboxypeptidase [Mogibacterium sp.]|nr:D-alanyl-D-alanine carboxypeptidase [Mogibacterium sp.]
MKKLMVAIISLMLILVTTISYSAPFVFAVDEEQTQEQPAPEQPQEQPATEQPQEQPAPEQPAAEQPAPEQPAAEQPAPEQPAPEPSGEVLPQISSSSWIVMSGSTSQIVAGGHQERKMQPGSITVLMTAMVVIDNMYNDAELKNKVEITPELAEQGTLFKEGETVTVGDLLRAMLVGGDGQAAEALASYSASSRDIFINEMNSKCMELDIMDTQFVNASGRYETMQYSTAKDCAVITQAAMRYQKIKDLLKKKSVIVRPSTKENEREIEIVSSNPLIAGKADEIYKYSKGGIRGVLEEPAQSVQFAAVSMKDGMQMIAILMDSDPALYVNEAKGLLEYGDAHAEKNTIVKAGKREGVARVRGGVWTRVAGYTETKGYAYVPPEGSDKLIRTEVVMLDNLEAPLKEGAKVGEFRVYVADELKGTVDLVTDKPVAKGWPPSQWYISNLATVIISLVLILIIAFLLRVLYVKRRRAKRTEAMRRAKVREIAQRQIEMDEDRRRRNWTGYGYEPLPPRTTDIRRENMNDALKGEGKDRGK